MQNWRRQSQPKNSFWTKSALGIQCKGCCQYISVTLSEPSASDWSRRMLTIHWIFSSWRKFYISHRRAGSMFTRLMLLFFFWRASVFSTWALHYSWREQLPINFRVFLDVLNVYSSSWVSGPQNVVSCNMVLSIDIWLRFFSLKVKRNLCACRSVATTKERNPSVGFP